ncbi:PilN domain-containing protein [Desulfonatronovibrio hydrogenovorans]|uniref:PilN domain-containing protein n=1 Tax=Desulfonatronovibrio hydrogenovorans TaxID=53245 RepID=UPI0004911155|nr:PilN domain-containing protein [Desulfonatronovibrio hydrogenovorans]
MIKINLLPQAKRARTSDTERQIIVFLVLLLLISASLLTSGLWHRAKINDLERIAAEKRTQRQALLARVARINELQRKFDEVEANIEAIREIRLKQQLPVRYIDETIRKLPGERIWFEALSLDRQGLMDIRGVALDNQAFAGYVDDLRGSPFIRSVSTQRTSRRQVLDLDLVEFQFQVRAGPVVSATEAQQHEN